jgi:hypothetical protein
VGQVYITTSLGLPAHNARRDAEGLLAAVRRSLDGWNGKGAEAEQEASALEEPAAVLR